MSNLKKSQIANFKPKKGLHTSPVTNIPEYPPWVQNLMGKNKIYAPYLLWYLLCA